MILAMAKDMHSINLLPNKGESLLTQFLQWGLSVGRLLIILTETLALSVFIYRFSLDMRIVDLHDQIKAESFIVQNFTSAEDRFRNVQERIALAKDYNAEGNIAPTVFRDVAEMGRGKVTFKTLLVASDGIKIEAQAPSSQQLAAFVNELKAYPDVQSLSIDKVENKPASAMIAVTINAKLKSAKPTGAAQQNTPVQQDNGL